MDGTFKTAPPGWYQLYTIHFDLDRVSYPAVYALLKSKTRQTYTKLFRFLQKHAAASQRSFRATQITMDFEQAAISAARTIFPTSRIVGCLFHYSKAIRERVADCGLRAAYRTKGDLWFFIRSLVCLCYLPPGYVRSTFNSLVALAQSGTFSFNFSQVMQLVDYYEKN